MSLLSSLLVPPILLTICIPIILLATITSAFAFSALFVRVLIVYIEFGAAIIQNNLHSRSERTKSTTKKAPTPPASGRPTRPLSSSNSLNGGKRKSRRSSAGSLASSNGGSVTPRALDAVTNSNGSNGSSNGTTSTGLGIYSGGGATRDFEGVGGWRLPDEEEDSLWAKINSRLELPATETTSTPGTTTATAAASPRGSLPRDRERNHHRSRTSSSGTAGAKFFAGLSSVRSSVPGPPSQGQSQGQQSSSRPSSSSSTRTGTGTGTTTNNRRSLEGPGGYFASGSKSTTALDTSANIGRTLLRHKSSASSGSGSASGSSASSAQALHLTISSS